MADMALPEGKRNGERGGRSETELRYDLDGSSTDAFKTTTFFISKLHFESKICF